MSYDWMPDDEEFDEVLHRRAEELHEIPDTLPDEDGLILCPVLPLREIVIFPRMMSPLFLNREASLLAVEEAHSNHQTVIALIQRDSKDEFPGPSDFYPIGVELAVGRLLNLPDGSSSALVQGRKRVEVVDFVQLEPFLYARARIVLDDEVFDRETDALMRTVIGLFNTCVSMNRSIPEEARLYAIKAGWQI
jgi:ATP-dependent Lon protease